MILFASSGLVNSMIIDDADLLVAFLVSQPTYLISALGIWYKWPIVLFVPCRFKNDCCNMSTIAEAHEQ